MKPECIKKVEAYLSQVHGSPQKLTKAQVDAIDKRFRQSVNQIFTEDPTAFRNMTPEERTVAAGIHAADAVQKKADSALQAKQWQIQKRVDRQADLKAGAATAAKDGGTKGKKNPHTRMLEKMLAQTDRQKGANAAAYTGQLSDLWAATKAKFGGLPLFGEDMNDQLLSYVFREMRGENTNDATAKQLAAGVTKIYADIRERLNSFGAGIEELKDYVPQDHNGALINKAGRETWTEDLLGAIDKKTFLDADGNQMNDDSIRDVLSDMFDTITTNGRSKKEYNETLGQIEGPLGARSVMQRASSFTRRIHFKDAAAHEAYHAKYSELKPGAMLLSTIERAGEDLALVQQWGPDARQNITKLIDVASHLDDQHAKAIEKATGKPVSKDLSGRMLGGILSPHNLMEAVLGRDDDYTSGLANLVRITGAHQTATKLVRTAVRAVPIDMVSMATHALELGQASKLPQMMKALTSGATKAQLRQMGIGTQIIQQALMASGRRVAGVGKLTATGAIADRMAGSIMRLSGLQKWTRGTGVVGQLTHGMHLADNVGKDWAGLTIGTRQLFSEVGINEANWDSVRRVPVSDIGGMKIPDVNRLSELNLPAAEHNEIQRTVQAFLWDGANKITNERDLIPRNLMNFGTKPGSAGRAFLSSMFLFRGIVSVITANIMRRAGRRATMGGKIGVTAGYMGGMTLAGFVGNAGINLADGKEIPDASSPDTWFKAFTTGGGAGFYGDIITSAVNDVTETQTGGGKGMAQALGPVGSDVDSLLDITTDLYKYAFKDKPEALGQAGFHALKFGRQQLPWLNLWYTKKAVDRMFMDDVNEAVMPGYQGKMEGLGEKYGNPYWWTPSGDIQPPQMNRALPGHN